MKLFIKSNYFNVLLISGSSIIGGLINYAYHPIMLQFLSVEEFGSFASLVGVFNILGILIAGIVLFLTKEYSKNINNPEKLKYIFLNVFKILSSIGIFVFLFYILFSVVIKDFLNIESAWLIVITGISIIFAFSGASTGSLLVSLKKFHIISILNILGPILKLIVGVGLIYMGFSIYGAIGGFVISAFLGVIIAFLYVKRYFRLIESIGTTKELIDDFLKDKKSILNYFLVSLFFATFMNIDTILAKNIFDAETAGIYAGISVLGKFLIFLFLSIETVYYGQIMEYTKNKLPFHLIKNPLVLMIIGSILALGVNFILGEYLLHILKEELSAYTNIYLLILVYYSLLAFISFFTKVLVGWGSYYINYIFGFLSVLLITIVYMFGNTSLEYFVYSFIISGIFAVLLTGGVFFMNIKKDSKNRKL